MSPLNQARVWEFMASRCDMATNEGLAGNGRYLPVGLCWFITALEYSRSVTPEDAEYFRTKLRPYRHRSASGYWWPRTPKGYQARAKVCRQLAREALSGALATVRP